MRSPGGTIERAGCHTLGAVPAGGPGAAADFEFAGGPSSLVLRGWGFSLLPASPKRPDRSESSSIVVPHKIQRCVKSNPGNAEPAFASPDSRMSARENTE